MIEFIIVLLTLFGIVSIMMEDDQWNTNGKQ